MNDYTWLLQQTMYWARNRCSGPGWFARTITGAVYFFLGSVVVISYPEDYAVMM